MEWAVEWPRWQCRGGCSEAYVGIFGAMGYAWESRAGHAFFVPRFMRHRRAAGQERSVDAEGEGEAAIGSAGVRKKRKASANVAEYHQRVGSST